MADSQPPTWRYEVHDLQTIRASWAEQPRKALAERQLTEINRQDGNTLEKRKKKKKPRCRGKKGKKGEITPTAPNAPANMAESIFQAPMKLADHIPRQPSPSAPSPVPTYKALTQTEVPETHHDTPIVACTAFNDGQCVDSNCQKSHEPDEFSVQLGPGLPNICKSFFVYHMSCQTLNCPYSHELKDAGMPLDRPALFISLLSELRRHGASEFLNARVEALLAYRPKVSTNMSDDDAYKLLLRKDKKAIIFSPFGPVICKSHLLDSKGCTGQSCTYSHDISALKLAERSKESAIQLFDSIKAYWDWGSPLVTHKVFITEFPGMENTESHDLHGLNGAEILQLLKTSPHSLMVELDNLAISRESLLTAPKSSKKSVERLRLANALAEAVQVEGFRMTGADILEMIKQKQPKVERAAKKDKMAESESFKNAQPIPQESTKAEQKEKMAELTELFKNAQPIPQKAMGTQNMATKTQIDSMQPMAELDEVNQGIIDHAIEAANAAKIALATFGFTRPMEELDDVGQGHIHGAFEMAKAAKIALKKTTFLNPTAPAFIAPACTKASETLRTVSQPEVCGTLAERLANSKANGGLSESGSESKSGSNMSKGDSNMIDKRFQEIERLVKALKTSVDIEGLTSNEIVLKLTEIETDESKQEAQQHILTLALELITAIKIAGFSTGIQTVHKIHYNLGRAMRELDLKLTLLGDAPLPGDSPSGKSDEKQNTTMTDGRIQGIDQGLKPATNAAPNAVQSTNSKFSGNPIPAANKPSVPSRPASGAGMRSSPSAESDRIVRQDLVFVKASTEIFNLGVVSGETGEVSADDLSEQEEEEEAEVKVERNSRGKVVWRKKELKARKGHYLDGEVVGASAPEVGSDTKGHAMLAKMGWKQGDGLGKGENKGKNLLPVETKVKLDKKGLGAGEVVASRELKKVWDANGTSNADGW